MRDVIHTGTPGYVTWVPYHHTAVNRDVTHTSEPYFSSRMCICSATSPNKSRTHTVTSEHMSDSFLSACSVRASDLQKICADSNQAATAPPLARQASTVFRELGGSIVSLLLLSDAASAACSSKGELGAAARAWTATAWSAFRPLLCAPFNLTSAALPVTVELVTSAALPVTSSCLSHVGSA